MEFEPRCLEFNVDHSLSYEYDEGKKPRGKKSDKYRVKEEKPEREERQKKQLGSRMQESMGGVEETEDSTGVIEDSV